MDRDGCCVPSELLANCNSEESPPAREATEDQESIERSERVRARTISIKRLSKRELERGRLLYPETEERVARPSNRGDCMQGEGAQRPCPFVSCKFHLYLDVSERTGAIKLNFPDLEVWQMPESCALDIADRAGITLEEVGEIMNLTRERIRQIETKCLAKLKALNEIAALQDYVQDEPTAPRPAFTDGHRMVGGRRG